MYCIPLNHRRAPEWRACVGYASQLAGSIACWQQRSQGVTCLPHALRLYTYLFAHASDGHGSYHPQPSASVARLLFQLQLQLLLLELEREQHELDLVLLL